MLNARELYQEGTHFESVGLQDDDLRGVNLKHVFFQFPPCFDPLKSRMIDSVTY